MEQDIKILEKVIHLFKSNDTKCLSGLDIKSLENLIKGYRALGEDYNHRCQLAIDRKIELENSIPKSKIKEKIEEVNQEFDRKNTPDNNEWYIDSEICAYATQVLQELLESEE